MSGARLVGNPYSSVLAPRPQSSLYTEWARTGYRRGLANYPWFVDAKSGDLVVTERDNHRVQIFDCVGNETRFEPQGGFGHSSGKFCRPGGVTTTNDPNSHIIIADSGNKRVSYFRVASDYHGNGILEQTYSFGTGLLQDPTGVEMMPTRGHLVVTDLTARRVTVHDARDGQVMGEMHAHHSRPMLAPVDVTVDRHGRSFVTDANANCVHVFDSNGDFVNLIGGLGHGPGEFDKPWGVCIDRQENLIVADEGNNRVQMFSLDGRFQRVLVEAQAPKGVSVNVHENLVLTCGDPYNFLKIIKYK